jgi:hypothetical protein
LLTETIEKNAKNLRYQSFSGKKEHFVMWQDKFLNYTHFKKFDEVIQGTKKLIVKDTLSNEEK